MKKYLALALVALALVAACLCLFSCGKDETSLEAAMAEIEKITFKDKIVVYSGKEKKLTVNTGLRYNRMPEGLSVSYEGNGKIEVGEYEVKAIFSKDGVEIPEATKTAKLTITKAASDPADFLGDFKNTTVSYNGQVRSLKLDETKLPEGVTVTYDYHGQEPKAAGTYEITAKFSHSEAYLKNYQPIPDQTVTLTVEKKTFDTSGFSFKKKYAIFTGMPVSVQINGTLPEGLSVKYMIDGSFSDGVSSVGTHRVTAIFSAADPNYEAPAPMETTLVIYNENYTSSAGISYKENSDKSGYIISSYKGNSTYLVIPDTYNGKPVTEIAANVFINKAFSYVYVPDTVTTIGNAAFMNCKSLKEVNLSNSLTSLGKSAFSGCTSLETIILPDSLKDIQNALFNGCTALKSVTLGAYTTNIGTKVFYGCKKLDRIYIPKTIKSIAKDAAKENDLPFLGVADNFVIAFEDSAVPADVSENWSTVLIDEDTSVKKMALVLYSLSYDEYIIGYEELKNSDTTDALLESIFINGVPLSGFKPATKDYVYYVNILYGYPEITVKSASPAALVTIVPANAKNGVAKITVKSADGEKTEVYTITFNKLGVFDPAAEIVNKNGTDAVVTYVIDDGYQDTATFAKSMLNKYSNLAFSFAVWTKDLATLKTQTVNGIEYYVKDENGKYVYTTNQTNINFWKNILDDESVAAGRVEMISHTHTHLPWGVNDDGGEYKYVDNSGNINTLTVPVGSSSKEFYAPKQIIGDLFPNLKNLTMITPGIGVRMTDFTTPEGEYIPTYYTYFESLLKETFENNVFLATRGTFTPDASGNYDDKVITKDMMTSITARMSLPGLAVKDYDEVSLWTDYIDAAINKGGWACFCIHEMDNTPTNQKWFIPTEKADQLFAYTNNKNVWVTTFSDACIYHIEWSTAEVTSEYSISDEKISVKITDTAKNDKDIFNMALTVKVNVPVTWDTAYVGTTALTLHTDASGSNFVYVDVLPDGATVNITLNAAE